MRVRGTCHYCGQIRDVVVGDNTDLSQEEIDYFAALDCDCAGSRKVQDLENDKNVTEANIDTLFEGKEDHPAADILKKCIPLIQHSSISSISLQLNETTKINLGTTSKGALKVAKTVTIKSELKAE